MYLGCTRKKVKMEIVENKVKAENYQDQNLVSFLFNCKFIHYVPGRMTVNMNKEKLYITGELSAVEETIFIYVQEDNVKMEITEGFAFAF